MCYCLFPTEGLYGEQSDCHRRMNLNTMQIGEVLVEEVKTHSVKQRNKGR